MLEGAAPKSKLHLNDKYIDEGEKLTDPDVLMKVMSIWEEVDEAEGGDMSTLMNENQDRIDTCIKKLSHAFKAGDLEKARSLTIELQYWTNLQYQLREM
ncbi:hypothetical protein HDV05_001316 [Chytridiales sp. JEL 0842]|nr:hypothetical protein HDV05_001316 [Chytridiales sp. JEL 0842]